jgi:hypothetical protein
MNNSFPTFPKRLFNEPCDCDQLFDINNKIYIQSDAMIAPHCDEGIPILDNRDNNNPCYYEAYWSTPMEFDEFGVMIPLVFESVILQYARLSDLLFGFGDLGPNADLKQWIMSIDSDTPWTSPLIGAAPLTNPCNPSGNYVNFVEGGVPVLTQVSLAPFN